MKYYLFAILDNVICGFFIMLTVTIIAGIFLFMSHAMEYDKEKAKKYLMWLKRDIYAFFILLGLGILTPSQKQMAFIIAAPYIIENQQLQDAGKNTADIIKLGTDYLKELLQEKKDENTAKTRDMGK